MVDQVTGESERKFGKAHPRCATACGYSNLKIHPHSGRLQIQFRDQINIFFCL